MESKKCTKCGEVKPFSAFSRLIEGRYGLNPQCKECKAKYYQTRKDKHIAQLKQYYKNNPDAYSRKLKYISEWQKKNKDKLSKQKSDRRNKNIEIVREKERAYFIANKERHYASCKKYVQENKHIRKKCEINYYKKNKSNETYRHKKKEYQLKNRDSILNLKKSYRVDLVDSYIKDQLKSDGFREEIIKSHPELIEIKKIIIQTKRLIKNKS